MAKRTRPSEADETSASTRSTGTARPKADRASRAPTRRAQPAQPSEDEIRERAYHRYLQRGGGHGMDFEDWLEAEKELLTSKKSRG